MQLLHFAYNCQLLFKNLQRDNQSYKVKREDFNNAKINWFEIIYIEIYLNKDLRQSNKKKLRRI